jgi:hypothetical protein
MDITLCGRESRPLRRVELFFTDRAPVMLSIREEQDPVAQLEQRIELMDRFNAEAICTDHIR